MHKHFNIYLAYQRGYAGSVPLRYIEAVRAIHVVKKTYAELMKYVACVGREAAPDACKHEDAFRVPVSDLCAACGSLCAKFGLRMVTCMLPRLRATEVFASSNAWSRALTTW